MVTKQRIGHRTAVAGLYSLLIVLAIVSLLPLVFMGSNSLKTLGETISRVNPNPLHPEFWPRELQWDNYRVAMTEGDGLWRYLLNSLIMATITTVGMFATTIPAAYAFAKIPFPGRGLIFSIFLITLMIPETVLTLPNFITVSRLGWNNSLAALTIPFMGSAFFIFFLRQFFKQLPDSLIESARIDGASTWKIMWSIGAPLARGPLFTIGFLNFTLSWNSLQWPLMVINSPQWRPITVGLKKYLDEAGPATNLRMAASAIALLPILILYIIAQKQITEGVTRSGIKG